MLAVLIVDRLDSLAIDLVELSERFAEKVLPTVDGIIGVLGGPLARGCQFPLVEVGIGGHVFVLEFLGDFFPAYLGKEVQPFAHPVLQEKIVGNGQQVLVSQFGVKLENVQVSPVLSGKPVIEDPAVLAQLMSPGIDEGFVLEVLMKAARMGSRLSSGLEVESAPADHGRTGQVLLERPTSLW